MASTRKARLRIRRSQSAGSCILQERGARIDMREEKEAKYRTLWRHRNRSIRLFSGFLACFLRVVIVDGRFDSILGQH